MLATFVTMQGGGFRQRECLWFAVAWLPKVLSYQCVGSAQGHIPRTAHIHALA